MDEGGDEIECSVGHFLYIKSAMWCYCFMYKNVVGINLQKAGEEQRLVIYLQLKTVQTFYLPWVYSAKNVHPLVAPFETISGWLKERSNTD